LPVGDRNDGRPVADIEIHAWVETIGCRFAIEMANVKRPNRSC
jgi:hypothetical protein